MFRRVEALGLELRAGRSTALATNQGRENLQLQAGYITRTASSLNFKALAVRRRTTGTPKPDKQIASDAMEQHPRKREDKSGLERGEQLERHQGDEKTNRDVRKECKPNQVSALAIHTPRVGCSGHSWRVYAMPKIGGRN